MNCRRSGQKLRLENRGIKVKNFVLKQEAISCLFEKSKR